VVCCVGGLSIDEDLHGWATHAMRI
jgi:hypothetical protein